jgi:hypothetical protein
MGDVINAAGIVGCGVAIVALAPTVAGSFAAGFVCLGGGFGIAYMRGLWGR